MNINREKNESLTDYQIRLFENAKLLNLSRQEIADILNKESGLNYSESKWRKEYASYVRWSEYERSKNSEPNQEIDKLVAKKLELQKERNKLSAEKNEINKWIREQARTENIYDKIEDAITLLKPIKVPVYKGNIGHAKKQLLVDVADAHIGKEVYIEDLDGYVLSEYNTKIFENRMWRLMDYTVDIAKKEDVSHVTVLNLGDYLDGLLHTNQLKNQAMGVMEQVMYGAEFMAEWLNKLSEYVTIDYRSVTGNHAETRPLQSQRSDFREENLEILVEWYIRKRLENNNRVTVHKINHIIYFDVLGTKIMCVHGQDEKNLEKSLKDYQDIYNVKVHMLKSGHLHHLSNKTISSDGLRNTEFIQSPAICSFDDYALNMKKTSVAGSLITVIQEDYGKFATYDIRLG